MKGDGGDGGVTCMIVMPRLSGPKSAGDEVVYRHAVAHLGRSMTVVTAEFGSVGRGRRLLNLITRRAPPELARYIGRSNDLAIERALASQPVDVVCFLHEGGFTFLEVAQRLGLPCVLYPHNVHSVVARTDGSMFGRLFASAAARFERTWYGDREAGLVCISRTDAEGLKAVGVNRTDVRIAPPGAPPPRALDPGASVLPEVVLTGSYGWWRKRRHLTRFAKSPGRLDAPVLMTDPAGVEILGDQGRAMDKDALDWSSGLRFGLITDGFGGGFKLKSLEYVALNCLVLSYCDLSLEFEGLPHADEFVRHVSGKAEIARIMAEAAARPRAEFIERFLTFKAACLRRFDWDRCLEPLRDEILSKTASSRLAQRA